MGLVFIIFGRFNFFIIGYEILIKRVVCEVKGGEYRIYFS